MRPLWKGSISFGLVNIPVGLYPAIKSSEKIDFDMLRDSDMSRIRYRRVAEADGQEVPFEHIVKGYEYEKGSYVVVTRDDFQRVQIQSTQVIDIKEFVDSADIDPRYYAEPYFLAPEKGGDKAYILLRETLQQSKKVGIAKVVIRPPREHLAAIKPLGNLLTMELLHWAEELRDSDEIKIPSPDIGDKELTMAKSLVETMAGEWDPSKYRDEYREALLQVIEQKIQAHGKLPPLAQSRAQGPSKVVDLVSVLRESLAQAGKGQPSPRHASNKKHAARAQRHKKAA